MNQSEESARAASWLLAEYESTDIEDPTGWVFINEEPIFTFRSILDAGSPMRVTAADYHDPDRYCL